MKVKPVVKTMADTLANNSVETLSKIQVEKRPKHCSTRWPTR